jgi:hypothetical protein
MRTTERRVGRDWPSKVPWRHAPHGALQAARVVPKQTSDQAPPRSGGPLSPPTDSNITPITAGIWFDYKDAAEKDKFIDCVKLNLKGMWFYDANFTCYFSTLRYWELMVLFQVYKIVKGN